MAKSLDALVARSAAARCAMTDGRHELILSAIENQFKCTWSVSKSATAFESLMHTYHGERSSAHRPPKASCVIPNIQFPTRSRVM